jgi:hypothetical protein
MGGDEAGYWLDSGDKLRVVVNCPGFFGGRFV